MFHTGQLKKEDIAQKGLLQLQIHTKTTFQLWVTLPPKILRFSPYPPLPFTITQSISTTTPSVAQQQFSNLSVPPQSTSIHVPSSTTQSVTFWELPAFLSQSTIGGCQGSNACTVISLLLAKTYLTNKSFLQLKNHQPLTPSWILAFMSCIMGGNQAYDSFMQSPSYLGVVEAIPLVRSSLGSLSYEEELTVCFVKEPNSSEESALSFHLSRRLTNTNAAFTIINGLTISFVSEANDNIILMYSHLHLPKGAFLAQSQRSDIEELLNWLNLKLSATVNLRTVTFTNFR